MAQHRVVTKIKRPDPELVRRLATVHFTVLCIRSKVGRSRLIDPAIRPLDERKWSICGPAVTVTMDDPDHFMPSVAVDLAQPGDVLVVAANGEPNALVWGGTMTRTAKFGGLAGVVVDGMIETIQPILRQEIPVFARGVYPIPGAGNKPGSVNVPVSCGGVTVNPGDIVVGNEDGLIVLSDDMWVPIIDELETASAGLREYAAKATAENHVSLFKSRNGMEKIRELGIEWVD